jgi:DNA-binding SARP family transcriptional activator
MLCYDQIGRKGEAINTYHRCRRVFSAAYGIEPGKPIRDLHGRLLE